jgi:hypothetical protein
MDAILAVGRGVVFPSADRRGRVVLLAVEPHRPDNAP